MDDAIERLDARWATLQSIMAFERLLGCDLCGMTGRPGVYAVRAVVNYDARSPLVETTRRFCGVRPVLDCDRWAKWLVVALGVTRPTEAGGREPVPLGEVATGFPLPEPADFHEVRVWPTLAPSDG